MRRLAYCLVLVATASIQGIGAPVFAQGWFDSGYGFGQAGNPTGQYGYQTDSTWQGAYCQPAPGSQGAGLGQTNSTGSQGWMDLGLPETTCALQAQGPGYNRPAVRQWGTGGFSGGGARPFMGVGGGGFGGGGMLPPCSMTPCDFDVTSGLGGGPSGGCGGGGGGCGGGGGGCGGCGDMGGGGGGCDAGGGGGGGCGG